MYEELKTALLAAESIPLREYAWATRPTGKHGVFQLDFETSNDNGNDMHQDRAWEGSIDLYTNGADNAVYTEIEGILNTYCEGCWYVNLIIVDEPTRLLHREYVFQVEVA